MLCFGATPGLTGQRITSTTPSASPSSFLPLAVSFHASTYSFLYASRSSSQYSSSARLRSLTASRCVIHSVNGSIGSPDCLIVLFTPAAPSVKKRLDTIDQASICSCGFHSTTSTFGRSSSFETSSRSTRVTGGWGMITASCHITPILSGFIGEMRKSEFQGNGTSAGS